MDRLQDLDDFEMLHDHQMEYINKILENNTSDRKYDLIDIEIYESEYVFMIKNVNRTEKLQLLICINYMYPESEMEFHDINGDYINIDDDFEDFIKKFYSDKDVVYSDCNLYKEYMYYWLKNNGFSPNRICKVDINNI